MKSTATADAHLIRCLSCGATNRVPRDKQEVDRIVGVHAKAEIVRRLERVMV